MSQRNMVQAVKAALKDLLLPIPQHLRARQHAIDATALSALTDSLSRNYHTGWRSADLVTPEHYQQDLENHLSRRMSNDRRFTVPWIDSMRRLDGARILEIGSGTGSSTVALAEQGAHVTGIDIDEGAMQVARDRCELYGVSAELIMANADTMRTVFAGRSFDVIIYFATLEHMTTPERLTALSAGWDMLVPGGILVVVDTPNRLWYLDTHTSGLPFFDWLPNDLAVEYIKFSKNGLLRGTIQGSDPDSVLHFQRMGRGVSFHEFDVAIGPTENLKVAGSMSSFRPTWTFLMQSRLSRRYKRLLNSVRPDIHHSFFDPGLELAIIKSSQSTG